MSCLDSTVQSSPSKQNPDIVFEQIPASQRVRIVYLGRMLRENASLVNQGWKAGNIINALVVARPSAS